MTTRGSCWRDPHLHNIEDGAEGGTTSDADANHVVLSLDQSY